MNLPTPMYRFFSSLQNLASLRLGVRSSSASLREGMHPSGESETSSKTIAES
jgi:hypothetical protein